MWVVPRKVVDETVGALSSMESEVFVLWTAPKEPARTRESRSRAGRILGRLRAALPVPGRRSIAISRAIVPVQDTHAGADGAYVHIAGSELRRIGFDNYERGERNAVQIHTHPSPSTRMSELDRKWEVVTHVGALSIIVPDYCSNGLESFRSASVYEREAGGRWRLWGAGEFKRRLRVK